MSTGFPRVAYDPDFAPFAFDDGGRPAGLAVEIVAAAFARAGRAAAFVAVPHALQDAALAGGEVDAVALKGVTGARTGDYDFSAPMFVSGGAWFSSAERSAPDPRPSAGARVATPAKGPLVAELAGLFPDLDVLKVDTYAEALRAVLDGRADVAALGLQVGIVIARRDFAGKFCLPQAPFKPIPMAVATAKGRDRPLLAAFDRALAALKADGTIAAIEARWMAA
jgi:ABC-type amino acid transport substrate-binding protein